MEKIIEREIAWRIFACEFNRSNLHISEGDERAPNYIITPTGVKCNRLFIVGVVTEVENIGKENSLWRARVADPTGVFTVYAGQYQPEFWRVVGGEGPCNRERLGMRVKAWDDGAWVREAALAHAEKQAQRQAAQAA
jgi:hypothetical protein